MLREDINKLKVANPSGLCAAHSAAARNKVAILAIIARYNGGRFANQFEINVHILKISDLNLEDKNGWTPLHHAVRHSALNAIEFLLDNGVIDNVLTKQKEAPVHLAVVHNQIKSLEVKIKIFIDDLYFSCGEVTFEETT